MTVGFTVVLGNFKRVFPKTWKIRKYLSFQKSAFDNVEIGATVIKFAKDNNHKNLYHIIP